MIASNADNKALAQCQIIGEYIEKNCPDIKVKIIIKDASEWDQFADAVVRSYGFHKKTCPLIYSLEGDLIGDNSNFVDYLRSRFGVSLTLTNEAIKQRQRLNM